MTPRSVSHCESDHEKLRANMRQQQAARPARAQERLAKHLFNGGQRNPADRLAERTEHDGDQNPSIAPVDCRWLPSHWPKVASSSGRGGRGQAPFAGTAFRVPRAQKVPVPFPARASRRPPPTIAHRSRRERYRSRSNPGRNRQGPGSQPTGAAQLPAVGRNEVVCIGRLEAIHQTGVAAEREELVAATHDDVLAAIDQGACRGIDERAAGRPESSPARTIRPAALDRQRPPRPPGPPARRRDDGERGGRGKKRERGRRNVGFGRR